MAARKTELRDQAAADKAPPMWRRLPKTGRAIVRELTPACRRMPAPPPQQLESIVSEGSCAEQPELDEEEMEMDKEEIEGDDDAPDGEPPSPLASASGSSLRT